VNAGLKTTVLTCFGGSGI